MRLPIQETVQVLKDAGQIRIMRFWGSSNTNLDTGARSCERESMVLFALAFIW